MEDGQREKVARSLTSDFSPARYPSSSDPVRFEQSLNFRSCGHLDEHDEARVVVCLVHICTAIEQQAHNRGIALSCSNEKCRHPLFCEEFG